jgi:hypothetical protein
MRVLCILGYPWRYSPWKVYFLWLNCRDDDERQSQGIVAAIWVAWKLHGGPVLEILLPLMSLCWASCWLMWRPCVWSDICQQSTHIKARTHWTTNRPSQLLRHCISLMYESRKQRNCCKHARTERQIGRFNCCVNAYLRCMNPESRGNSCKHARTEQQIGRPNCCVNAYLWCMNPISRWTVVRDHWGHCTLWCDLQNFWNGKGWSYKQ